MSLKIEANGRRSVEVAVEVPGTPEEVWQAIASGPGVSAWFVPTDIENGEDGKPARVIKHFGPGMDSVSEVTEWESGKRYVSTSRGWTPTMPSMATEWILETKSGDTCVVRVVHSLFASTDDWDDQLKGVESGWPVYFRVLTSYMTHFRGQPSAFVNVTGAVSGPMQDAWKSVTSGLGVAGASAGQRAKTNGSGSPSLGGVVEQLDASAHPRLILRLDEPGPGVAVIAIYGFKGRLMPALSLYLYGANATSLAAREQPRWQKWMAETFPMAARAGTAA